MNVPCFFRMGLGRRKEHNTIVTRLGQEDGEHDGAGAFQKLVLSETSPRSLTSSVTAGTWLSPSVPRSLRCNCGLLNTSRWGAWHTVVPSPLSPSPSISVSFLFSKYSGGRTEMLTEQGSLLKSKKFLKWKISFFFFFSNKLRKNYLRGQPIALIRTGNRKDKALGKGKLLSSIKKPYVHFFFFFMQRKSAQQLDVNM